MNRTSLACSLALALPTLAGVTTFTKDAAADPARVVVDIERRDGGREVIFAAPPAPRFENPGRAPSNRHFWIRGYQRWNGREYGWNPGRWESRRDGFRWEEARHERVGRGYRFHEGRWARR